MFTVCLALAGIAAVCLLFYMTVRSPPSFIPKDSPVPPMHEDVKCSDLAVSRDPEAQRACVEVMREEARKEAIRQAEADAEIEDLVAANATSVVFGDDDDEEEDDEDGPPGSDDERW